MVKSDQAKTLWDFQIQTCKMVVANQPDIVVMDKQRKTAVVIDVVRPNDSNISKKERHCTLLPGRWIGSCPLFHWVNGLNAEDKVSHAWDYKGFGSKVKKYIYNFFFIRETPQTFSLCTVNL